MTALEQLVDRADFSTSRKTVFIIHGYTENLLEPSVVTMVNAYLAIQSDVNLVGVDWSNLSNGDYFTVAVANTRKVILTFKLINFSFGKQDERTAHGERKRNA